jgi:hypothetical protein
MAAHVLELLKLRMYDRRLVHLPGHYDDLMDTADSLRVGLTTEEYRRLLDLRPQVAAWCAELAACRLKLAEDGPEMLRLRDAYLEPWTKYAPQERLTAALKLAYHLAMITRALAWHHGTGSLAWQHREP